VRSGPEPITLGREVATALSSGGGAALLEEALASAAESHG
jgi:hypothetical protein